MGLKQRKLQDNYHRLYSLLIQYKIYHTTNLYALQSNLLLERNQSNCFVSSPRFVPYSERSLFLYTHGADIPNAFAKSKAFFFIMIPSIGIFWLLFSDKPVVYCLIYLFVVPTTRIFS